MNADQVLRYVCIAGAVYCAVCYLYGFVLNSKGDRRFHVASLLFSGLGLLAFAVVTPNAAQGPGIFATGTVIMCLLASAFCQSVSAFRGRRSDGRRANDARGDATATHLEVVPDRRAKAA